ncbi:hypothetical protein C8D87_10645 [Lentzea atacamensis]|uniref:Uncharacterized protein n=1 Tax=Lentzea atacamensis TaxID=531938 RepID=A0ABX9E3L0_9PSEU|nr:hypothetical protein C8D87_10645 [Lentzea atacamensis]
MRTSVTLRAPLSPVVGSVARTYSPARRFSIFCANRRPSGPSWPSPFDVTFRASTGSAGGNEQRIFANSGEGYFLLIDSPPYSSDQTQAMPADASTSLSKSSVDAPAKATKQSSTR